MEVKSKISIIRKVNELTIKDLAKKTNLSNGTIFNAEKNINAVKISTLAKIAVALDVSINDLYEVKE